MTTFDKTTKQINGPINVVRLEGNISGIDKTIYVFMDQHYGIQIQTECENVFSMDIQQYFARNFETLNKVDRMYDFFLEIMPTRIQDFSPNLSSRINYRHIYINQVAKLFNKLFVYDSDKNKVSISKFFTNVRLHYMDIRDYFEKYFFEKFLEIHSKITISLENNYIHPQNLTFLIEFIEDFKQHVQLIHDIIESYLVGKPKSVKKTAIIKYDNANKNNPPQTKLTDEQLKQEEFEQINYLINKIFGVYTHTTVKNKLEKQINNIQQNMIELIDISENLITKYTNLRDTLTATNNKLIHDNNSLHKYEYGMGSKSIHLMISYIYVSVGDLFGKFVNFYTLFMDIYFLRRFLDKDYITNTITYTGSYHSLVYVHILVNDFGFRVTHAAYSKIPIEELNSEINKRDIFDLAELLYPPTRSQCSDVTHFPKNFL